MQKFCALLGNSQLIIIFHTHFWINSWRFLVCPTPGMISTQNRGNKTRNCASDVQNRKDTKPAWVWLLPRNLIAFSSITKERAEIPLQRETKSKQNKNKFSVNFNYSCFKRGCQKKCKSADDNPKRYSFCGRFSGHGSLTTGFQGNLRNIIARSLFSTNFIEISVNGICYTSGQQFRGWNWCKFSFLSIQ